ncbi:MAG: hypothetical protein GTO14_19800 [Anaerolineales bacterium]|nr:hypothetical protein [Anaerolineales bacterium]
MDLLHPARRLWRHSLPDCRLGTLERTLLGVRRTADDVPGELIPGMYLDYLRTGDASDMGRVVYHNAVDILSLVGLTVQVLGRHREEDIDSLSSAEALAVARWHQDAGRIKSAEAAFLTALNSDEIEVKVEALRRYAVHLKQEGRRGEAVKHWQAWHSLSPDDPLPCIELAKYYEWHVHDLGEAKSWAENALLCLSYWPKDWRREQLWSQIEHRLARLARKIGT